MSFDIINPESLGVPKGWSHGMRARAGGTLLFVAGVMNLIWVAAIAAFVLVEKLAPHGRGLGRATGLLLMAWGIWVMVAGR